MQLIILDSCCSERREARWIIFYYTYVMGYLINYILMAKEHGNWYGTNEIGVANYDLVHMASDHPWKIRCMWSKVVFQQNRAVISFLRYNQFQKEDSVLFANRATPKGLEQQNTFVNVTAEDRRQNLDRMLSKTSVSCLDLSVPSLGGITVSWERQI